MHWSMLAASYWMLLASSWQGQTLLLTNVSEAPQSFPPCHHTVHEPFGRTCGADASPTESETITDITHLIKRAQKKSSKMHQVYPLLRKVMPCPVHCIAWMRLTNPYHAFTMPYLSISYGISWNIWAYLSYGPVCFHGLRFAKPKRQQRVTKVNQQAATTSKSWKAVSQCPAPIAAP